MDTTRRPALILCLIAGFLALAAVGSLTGIPKAQAAAVLPELPRVYVDTTFPRNTGRMVNVKAGPDLQAALDSAQCGDTIVLEAGATFIGGFRLRNVGECGGNWIVIRSSNLDRLPAQGTRVKPSDAANMPRIVSPSNEPAIQTMSGANYYWLSGLEITTTYMAPNIIFSLVYLAAYTIDLPHHIVVDRSYIHGNAGQYVNSGVGMAGSHLAVVDSYVSRVHDLPFESQAVYACKGPGPYKVVNNFLEATGENFFSGDCGSIPGVIESDIELRGNYIYKPTSWYTESADYEGVKWCVKNSIEFKNGQRALIEGNVIEHNYPQGQVGWAIVFTPRKNGTPYVNDITFRNNIVKGVPNGVNIMGRDDGDRDNPILKGTSQTNRILIQNNIFDDVDGTRWGGPGGSWGALYQVSGHDITIDHNTGFQKPHATGGIGWVGATYEGVKAERFTFTNNLHNYNRGGLGVDGLGDGFPALNKALADNYAIEGNALVLTNNKFVNPACYACDSQYYASRYPPGNHFPLYAADVGMADYHEGVDGDYSLLPSSPYRNAGTDGRDLGADIAAVRYATRGAVSGVWNADAALSPASQSFGPSGGNGDVRVTSFTGSYWSAASNSSWITITSGAGGSGNGMLSYVVAANPGSSARTGTLTIAGQTFPVNQEGGSGGGAVIAVSPLSIDFGRVRAGETSSQQVQISNKGTGPLSLRGITFLSRTLGIFSHEGSCETLGAGESCSLAVKFTPPYAGPIQGIMKIYSNASNGKGNQVRLKGAGF